MITRTSLADEIDVYDQSIADLNSGKKDCFDAYRDQLVAAGVAKPNIKLEIEAVKAAIKRRRAVAKNEMAVEEKDALVDEIFVEITRAARAPRVTRENIEEFGAELPAHDADGVIIEQPETANETKRQVVTGGSSRETAANVDQGVTAGETAHSGIAQGRGEGRTLPVQVSSPAPATNSPSAVTPPAENTGAVVSSSAAAPVANSTSASDLLPGAEQTGADDLLQSVPVTHSPAHGPCLSIARKTPKTEPALDALAGDLGFTPCKGQNATPPANHSDDVPAFLKAKEGCLRPSDCKTHFTSALFSGCANERAKGRVSA